MIAPATIRRFALEVLASGSTGNIRGFVNDVGELIKSAGAFPTREECQARGSRYDYYERGQLNPIDELNILETWWDLLVERVVTPGSNASNENLPFFRVTDFGQQYLKQREPHYYDSQGYLETLKAYCSDLDAVVAQYAIEGVQCFRRGLLFATAVMFGAASERAILSLLEAMAAAESDPRARKQMTDLIENPKMPTIFDTVQEKMVALIKGKALPYEVHQGGTEHLLSLLETVRVQRNDAVHPHAGKVSRTKVLMMVNSFPGALGFVNRLRTWFEAQTT